jgi:hypothetical protein
MNINLHKAQSETLRHLFGKGSDTEARAAVLSMSRGAGKSVLAAVTAAKGIEKLLAMPSDVLNKRVIIVGPTWSQTVEIYVPYLNGMLGMDYYASKHTPYAGKWWFGENEDVTLELASAESIQRQRGKGAYLVITDESTSWEIDIKEAFEGVINPMQTTRWPNAWKQLNISTPMGHDYYWELSTNEEKDSRWKTILAPYQQIPHLDKDEIERSRATMDPVTFAREYECSFEGSSNKIFYNFNRKVNIDRDIPDFDFSKDARETVHVGMDFNVNINATIFFAIRGKQVHVINELKGAPNTEECVKYIKGIYPNAKLIAYPDPTGRSNKTSASVGSTDFTIIEKQGIATLAHKGSPSVKDSVAAVNAMLLNANGESNLLIHPRCVNLIKDLESASWLDSPEKAIIDKRGEKDPHFADALKYPMEYLFPIRRSTKTVSRGFSF